MTEDLIGRPTPGRLYRLALAFALLTLLAFLVDLPVAKFWAAKVIPGDFHRVFGWAEVFAHGLGVALIGLTMFVLDAPRRRQIPRVLASAYVAGLFGNVGKAVIARIRPRYFDLDGNVFDSFLGWFPLIRGTGTEHGFEFNTQSFPSGHTASAVGLAVGLTCVYPQGRWLFVMFAALAACQRMDVGSHYLSDTTAAAAVGLLGAALVADERVLGRWLDRIERKTEDCRP